MDTDKLIDYLEKQIAKRLEYDCVPESNYGFHYVSRDSCRKIINGLIPMIKEEINKKKTNG